MVAEQGTVESRCCCLLNRRYVFRRIMRNPEIKVRWRGMRRMRDIAGQRDLGIVDREGFGQVRRPGVSLV